MSEPLALLCGQLLTIGLAGPELSASERKMLEEGACGGVVLFKRNISDDIRGVRALTRAVTDAATTAAPPPLVSIDQEGGRVMRIGPPALPLPAMRRIGDLGDDAFAERLAEAQARELAALGFTLSFAPVADVHTRPENPVIGDRSFASDAATVTRFAAAWARGLERGGILSCAKHFPGHGDTTVDSHLALPRVDRPLDELVQIELAPFRALAMEPALSAIMTAHVVFSAIDDVPATLSKRIATGILREELDFRGATFSDDMEMRAIQLPMREAAVRAVSAGCDILLMCHREDLAREAHEALIKEAEASTEFRARVEEAHRRATALRSRLRPVAAKTDDELTIAFEASAGIVNELRERLS